MPEKYTIELTGAELQSIGNGLYEMPYKLAAPILASIQAQVKAQEQPPAEAAPAPKRAGRRS